jgi:hypothetical protein
MRLGDRLRRVLDQTVAVEATDALASKIETSCTNDATAGSDCERDASRRSRDASPTAPPTFGSKIEISPAEESTTSPALVREAPGGRDTESRLGPLSLASKIDARSRENSDTTTPRETAHTTNPRETAHTSRTEAPLTPQAITSAIKTTPSEVPPSNASDLYDGPSPTDSEALCALTLTSKIERSRRDAIDPSSPGHTPHASPVHARSPGLAQALERLGQTRRQSARPEPPAPTQHFHMPALFSEGGPPPSLAEALPGSAQRATRGSTWLTASRHPLGDRHGLTPLGLAQEVSYRHVERLTGDPRLHGFALDKALFLDIEATGLEHGAGTLAFMIGLGHLEDDAFVVNQLILRDPDDEPAQLELLWEAVERFPYLVSFNGKSFDLSVLQSRLVMNRLCSSRDSELKLRPHLDLLHLGRNLYREAFPDTRLQTLEQRVLGFVRESDMPGALAPACWFAWLRDADPRPLAAIALHNRWDVVSMLALAARFAEVARPEPDSSRTSRLALNLAKLYARRRHPADALAILDGPSPLASPEERDLALELEATCARRVGDFARLAETLETLLARHPDDPALARALARTLRKLESAGRGAA